MTKENKATLKWLRQLKKNRLIMQKLKLKAEKLYLKIDTKRGVK